MVGFYTPHGCNGKSSAFVLVVYSATKSGVRLMKYLNAIIILKGLTKIVQNTLIIHHLAKRNAIIKVILKLINKTSVMPPKYIMSQVTSKLL